MEKEITIISTQDNPYIQYKGDKFVGEKIQYGARKMWEQIKKLEENYANILTLECNSQRGKYLIGRIANPPIKDNGKIKSSGTVFMIDYDLEKGSQKKDMLNEIKKENIKTRFEGFFPIHICQLVYPGKFVIELGGPINQIRKATISNNDSLLKRLEEL